MSFMFWALTALRKLMTVASGFVGTGVLEPLWEHAITARTGSTAGTCAIRGKVVKFMLIEPIRFQNPGQGEGVTDEVIR
jgi:hypothetical protein